MRPASRVLLLPQVETDVGALRSGQVPPPEVLVGPSRLDSTTIDS